MPPTQQSAAYLPAVRSSGRANANSGLHVPCVQRFLSGSIGRLVVGGLVAIVSLVGANDANAQDAPAPAPAAAESTVHVSFNAKRKGPRRARVYQRFGDAYEHLCTTPCDADLLPGTELRFKLDGSDEPTSFTVPNARGEEVEVEVSSSRGVNLVGGLALLGIGGGVAALGLFMAVEKDLGMGHSTRPVSDEAKTRTAILLGVGATIAAAGAIWLLLFQSSGPAVRRVPPSVEHYGRADTLSSDIATAKPRALENDAPAPWSPLELKLAF